MMLVNFIGEKISLDEGRKILDQNTVPVYIPRYKVQDIDERGRLDSSRKNFQ